MNLVNPLAAFSDTYNVLEGMAQDRAKRQAGNALAQGDYGAASGALLGRGMLDAGMGVQRYQRDEQDRMATQQRQLSEQEAAAAKARADRGIAILTGMRGLAPDQLAAEYDGFLRPYLAETLPPEMLARIDAQPKTAENVDLLLTALGAERQKLETFTTKTGDRYAYDPQNPTQQQLIYDEPDQPERGEWMAQGGNWWFVEPGKPPLRGPALTAAPRAFAPPRPRSGGGGMGGTYSDVPAGARVVR